MMLQSNRYGKITRYWWWVTEPVPSSLHMQGKKKAATRKKVDGGLLGTLYILQGTEWRLDYGTSRANDRL